jgi:nucleotide-binding universal stress UspA family protein
MLALRRILVPVDFSPSTWPALEAATTLARMAQAEVQLLHVWEAPALAGPAEVYVDEDAESALESLLAEARQRGLIAHGARAISGIPHNAIVHEAEHGHYDLIVMGRHGRTALARALLGSVAERVVRHAPCAVLLAKL